MSVDPEKVIDLLYQHGELLEENTVLAGVIEEILPLADMENYHRLLKELSKSIDEYNFEMALVAFEAFSKAWKQNGS